MQILKRPEVKISLIFMLTAIAWIILSDKVLLLSTDFTPESLTAFQTYKGVAFISAVTCLIYVLILHSNKEARKTELDYLQLFANNPIPMWIYDIDTLTIQTVNKSAIENYGYSEAEFLAMTIRDLRPLEELVKMDQHLQKLITDKFSSGVWKHRKKNGSTMMVQIVTHELEFRDLSCRLVMAHDITEKNQLEQKLSQTNSELNTLINSITDGFFIISKDFRVIKSNNQLKELAEIGPDEIVGKKLTDLFVHTPDFPGTQKFFTAMRTQHSVHFESYYDRKDIWFRISGYPFEHGLLVFFRDITAERESKRKMLQNERNLNALINNTDDLIWGVDYDFRYFTYNYAYETNYKYLFKEEIYVGKTALNQARGNEHIRLWRGLYQRALSGEKFTYDMDILNKTTTISFNPIYNDKKTIIGVGCHLHDITQRRRYEKRIEEQNKKLREIASFTSHSVRAPLANLLGLIEAIDHYNFADPGNQQLLQYIHASAERLDMVIKDIVKQTADTEQQDYN
ncbi:PAS domain S-box protein [Segetibacter sp. 3557_3]|uniref:PAS domain-containing sensor histidine kinase n=1 Tax=Segetibacter sp. 3557_3 TaxID=2547429 RepID=UPI0010588288|nr:PAS domain S-box protein [Segetibacter sp. 3557_3]TDH25552.1 PAS domain S-box protein [Segetibacter sp. 3557_3]